MARQVTVRVQLATAHVGDATSSLFVRGSLPELGDCLMRRNGAMCTHDFVIQRVYEPGQTIQFEYYYEARDADGHRVWASRSSRCSLTMDSLLNHTLDSACGYSGHTKLVLQVTGVAAADPDAHVLATGSSFDLGNWDLKRAKKLRRIDKADRHHATLFLTKGTSHAYTVFLVQNSDRLFGRDSVPSSGSLDGAEVVWNSGVGVVELGLNDNACVVLLDRLPLLDIDIYAFYSLFNIDTQMGRGKHVHCRCRRATRPVPEPARGSNDLKSQDTGRTPSPSTRTN